MNLPAWEEVPHSDNNTKRMEGWFNTLLSPRLSRIIGFSLENRVSLKGIEIRNHVSFSPWAQKGIRNRFRIRRHANLSEMRRRIVSLKIGASFSSTSVLFVMKDSKRLQMEQLGNLSDAYTIDILRSFIDHHLSSIIHPNAHICGP